MPMFPKGSSSLPTSLPVCEQWNIRNKFSRIRTHHLRQRQKHTKIEGLFEIYFMLSNNYKKYIHHKSKYSSFVHKSEVNI